MSDRSSNWKEVQNAIPSLVIFQDCEQNKDILDTERLSEYAIHKLSVKAILKDMGFKRKTKSMTTDIYVCDEH